MSTAANTAVVGMRPKVENSWPMPTPKANVSSATRKSDETTRPNPAPLAVA